MLTARGATPTLTRVPEPGGAAKSVPRIVRNSE